MQLSHLAILFGLRTQQKDFTMRLLQWSLVLIVAWSLGCNSKTADKDIKVVRDNKTSNPDAKSPDGKSSDKKLRVAFITNQIADFWKISEAGCMDAQKDLGVSVDVRMPAQATAVEQKRIVEDLLTAGVDKVL